MREPVDLNDKPRRRLKTGQFSDFQLRRVLRQSADQVLARTSGAPLIPGNAVRLLKDAEGNFPVWLAAIGSAQKSIYFENYIFSEDDVGNAFAEALCSRARAGVKVRVVRDWLGSWPTSSRKFWRKMAEAGVELRAFNPPRLDSPFGWLSRDHRKMVSVDSNVAFVSGLCISQRWQGDPQKGTESWRDTGLEIRGPAVMAVEDAFAEVWGTIGTPIPEAERPTAEDHSPAGDVAVRVLAGAPNTAGLFRMDQLVAAAARQTLWLTDAYFVGVAPYVQALRAAARDGVDVRLLVPNTTDLPLVRSLSRAGYRPLLEAGVRIFEWNGPMIHAKTAVADRRWSRVGSSNLNIASFLGNYELDVAIDDEDVARAMEQMYLEDLTRSTEVLLSYKRWRRAVRKAVLHPATPRERRRGKSRAKGSTAAAGAIRIANAVGAAISNHRVLGAAESQVLLLSGLTLLALAALAVIWPYGLAIPVAGLATWVGGALIWRAFRLRAERAREKDADLEPEDRREESAPAPPPAANMGVTQNPSREPQ